MLKYILLLLIEKYGIENINDKLAEIFQEESAARDDLFYDELSESYDLINEKLKNNIYYTDT